MGSWGEKVLKSIVSQRQDWLENNKEERSKIMRGEMCHCDSSVGCNDGCLYATNSVLCVPGVTCRVDGDCGNRLPAFDESDMMKCFEVKEACSGKGCGLFTKKDFGKGRPLLLYNGPVKRRETEERNGNPYLCNTSATMFYNEGKMGPNRPKGERVVVDGRFCLAGACNHECGTDTSCKVLEKWMYAPFSSTGSAALLGGGKLYPVSVLCASTHLSTGDECVWNYDPRRQWSNCRCKQCGDSVERCGTGQFGETRMPKGSANVTIKKKPKKKKTKDKEKIPEKIKNKKGTRIMYMDPVMGARQIGVRRVTACLNFEAFEVMRRGLKNFEIRMLTSYNKVKFVTGCVVRFWYGQSFSYQGCPFWFDCMIVCVREVKVGRSKKVQVQHRFETGFCMQVLGNHLYVELGPVLCTSESVLGFPESLWDDMVREKSSRMGWKRRNVLFDSMNKNKPMLWTTRSLF
jgi:hypothetical protein